MNHTIEDLDLDRFHDSKPLQTRLEILNFDCVEEIVEAWMAQPAPPSELPPPIVVFRASRDDRVWIADGHHRFEAWSLYCERVDQPLPIRCEVHIGDRQDALRYALRANRRHGRIRSSGDVQNGFDMAVGEGLVSPWDSKAVQNVLQVGQTTANALTKTARDARADRMHARAGELHCDGKSHREIAEQISEEFLATFAHSTIAGWLAVQNDRTGQSEHPSREVSSESAGPRQGSVGEQEAAVPMTRTSRKRVSCASTERSEVNRNGWQEVQVVLERCERELSAVVVNLTEPDAPTAATLSNLVNRLAQHVRVDDQEAA